MGFFESLSAARVIFILGIVNLVTGVLVFFSCRCLPGSRIAAGRLMKNRAYRRFYTYHCYIWLVFWASVIVHAVFALKFYGWPG